MSTANFNAPLRRFVWKEYRTLRGLWLAVLILGLFIDWLVGVVMPGGTDFAALRLSIALASAALYAAGAAAILFSMEHEDQTYDFLRGLPATWFPAFAGKLLMALATSIALAAVLSIVGVFATGSRLTTTQNTAQAFGVLGVAILEATAWGTLCSLFFKRPLAAAIATLVVGALVTHLAVNAMSTSTVASADPQAYVSAVPLRLAIVVVVLGLCAAVARNWLKTSVSKKSATLSQSLNGLAAWRLHASRVAKRITPRSNQRRTSMIARLVWQSWRENWKRLLLPVVVSALCVAVAWLFFAMQSNYAEVGALVLVATMFFGPALYGALAFAADQRRSQVRFLAEHAAAPRYVWLSRHLVWLGTLIIVAAVTAFAISALAANLWLSRTEIYYAYERQYYPDPNLRFELRGFLLNTALVSVLSYCGILSAYSIGQLCSMLLRSDLLAAFLAMLLAVVLSAWVAALFLWQLSGWVFLLPLAAGLMLATWLRAPGWIIGRNTLRAWWKPTLAVAGTLFVLGMALPQQRLAQVRFAPRPHANLIGEASESTESDTFFAKQTEEGKETAAMYLKAAEALRALVDDDLLGRWNRNEYLDGGRRELLGINPKAIPSDQHEDFKTASGSWTKRYSDAIGMAIEASRRPHCQFEFPLDVERKNSRNRHRMLLDPGTTYEGLDNLLDNLIYFSPDRNSTDVSFEQLLAALRMNSHLRSGQPAHIAIDQLNKEQIILGQISLWATRKGRTNEERAAAIAKLREIFRLTAYDLFDPFYADQQSIREVILGKQVPFVLRQAQVPGTTHLAFLANELLWERERALIALDLITNQNLADACDLIQFLSQGSSHVAQYRIDRWLRPRHEPALWMMQQPAAATSYLVSLEYNARVQVNELFNSFSDTTTRRQALLIEIALAMYRADHDEYPATLAKLVPKYLEHEPMDPYSTQPFLYAPHGLELRLRSYGRFASRIGAIDIAAHTPLFWSVGPNDVRLQQSQYADQVVPEGQPLTTNGQCFILEPAWNSTSFEAFPLVFPLPK